MNEYEKLVVDVLIALKLDPEMRTYNQWSMLSKFNRELTRDLKEHFYKTKEKQPKEEKGGESKPEVLEFTDEQKFNRAMMKSPSLRTSDEWALINTYFK